jgi:hypothetical protein
VLPAINPNLDFLTWYLNATVRPVLTFITGQRLF